MFKIAFKYADGRTGNCIKDGKLWVCETKEEAEARAAIMNNMIEEELKSFFPTWYAEEV